MRLFFLSCLVSCLVFFTGEVNAFSAPAPLDSLDKPASPVSKTLSTQPQTPLSSRPKIALVLSGGGAKGAAHIGVIRVLEQNNIAVDYVVGTSIGAYVGGLYALGYNANEIEKIMLGLEWDRSYSDFIPREDLPYQDKQHRDRYNIALRMGFSDSTFKMPSGFILGQSASLLLRESTGLIPLMDDFDQLAIPYRAIASNLATAQAVVLSSGSVTRSMRASAAVPGIVEPVNINGQLLVDGGISNNMPIDVAKSMGADIVIAVDIGSSLLKQKDIHTTIDVFNQLSTILTNNTTKIQKHYLTERDILIRPAIDDLSTTDFSIMPQALVLGEKAANETVATLNQYSLSDKEFNKYKENKRQIKAKLFKGLNKPVTAIRYDNNSKVNEVIIEEHFTVKEGEVVNKDSLEEAVTSVYSLNQFEHVDVEFNDTPQGRELILSTEEKSWGPNYFDLGFNLQTDFNNRTAVAVDFDYTLTNVTDNGGRWENSLLVGWEYAAATAFFQPLTQNQKLFTVARGVFAQDKWDENKNRPEIINLYLEGRLGLGYEYSYDGVVEFGFLAENGNLSISGLSKEKLKYDSNGGYFSFNFDTLNSINFPTEGNKVSFNAYYLKDSYDGYLFIPSVEEESFSMSFDWRGALSLGKHSFMGITSLSTVDNKGDNPFTVHVSELGGFLNLSGYQKDALIGAHKVFSAVVYQYNLGGALSGVTGLPMYLGTSVEIGNVWDISETVKASELITSGSIYLGTDTSFGPAVLGVGYADDGETSVFLSIGKNW